MTVNEFKRIVTKHSYEGYFIISSCNINSTLPSFAFGNVYFNLCHSHSNQIVFENTHNMEITPFSKVVKPVNSSLSFFMADDEITEIAEYNGKELETQFAYKVDRIFEVKYKSKLNDIESACIIGFLGYKYDNKKE